MLVESYMVILAGPFRRFSTSMWQNACANTVRSAMVCNIYFPFLKFYNFIKGIIHIHSIFKKPKTNVFIHHLLQLATEWCIPSNVWKKIALIFLNTLYKAQRKLESSFYHSFLAVFPSFSNAMNFFIHSLNRSGGSLRPQWGP